MKFESFEEFLDEANFDTLTEAIKIVIESHVIFDESCLKMAFFKHKSIRDIREGTVESDAIFKKSKLLEERSDARKSTIVGEVILATLYVCYANLCESDSDEEPLN